MKRFILSVIAIIFPWLTLFLLDDPVGGIIALLLQASFIGWIPASMWAWRSIRKTEQTATPKESVKAAEPPTDKTPKE